MTHMSSAHNGLFGCTVSWRVVLVARKAGGRVCGLCDDEATLLLSVSKHQTLY